MLGLSVLVVGVWVGNDDRTPMKGVTGGSLPAEIWKQFVDAAMPNLDASSRLELARGTSDPSSAPVSDQAECDQAACAAAYRSFRASDCTYRSYGGSRKLCLKHLDRELEIVKLRSGGDQEGRHGRRRVLAEESTQQLLTPLDSAAPTAEEVSGPRRGTALRNTSPERFLSRSRAEIRSRSWPQPGRDFDRP